MTRYVALLRGINVGGKNLIRMPALKACFEDQGFLDVVTYIQSGNVLFSAGGKRGELIGRIEHVLSATFDYHASVVLRTRKEMLDIVRTAPAGFGAEPGVYRSDVLFLKEPLTAAVAMRSLPTRDGVDEAHAGSGVIYFSRLISRASQSHLNKLVSMPIYKSMTIRNWNTTTKLARLAEAPD